MSNSVSRFSLLFEVDGNWESALEKLPGLFQNVGGAADNMAVHVHDASASATASIHALHELREVGMKSMEAGMAFFEGMGDLIVDGVKDLMPLEGMVNRLVNIAKMSEESAREVVHNSLTLAEKTPFLQEDIAQMATALALAKVPLDAMTDTVSKADLTLGLASERGFTKMSEEALNMAKDVKVSSVSMMADLATVAGVGPERMQFFVRGMTRALSTGQLGLLRDELPDSFRKAIFETTGNKSKVTTEKAMKNLFNFLGKEGKVGAAAAASSTMEAYIAGFKDLKGKMFHSIFGMPTEKGSFYEQFKELVGRMYNTLSAAFGDEEFLSSIKGALAPIIDGAIFLGDKLIQVIQWMVKFVKEHPALVKIGTVMTAIGSGLLVVAGAMAVVVANIGLAIAAVAAFKVAIASPVMIAAFKTVMGFLMGAASWIGVLIAAGAALYLAWDTNFGGIREVVGTISLVLQGVWEGITNMTRRTTSMSEETAAALDKLGLLEFVLNLLTYANSIYNFFASIGDGFMDAMEMFGPTLEELTTVWDMLSESVGNLFKALGRIFPSLIGTGTAFQEVSAGGFVLGNMLGMVVSGIVRVIEFGAMVVATFIDIATWVTENRKLFSYFVTPLMQVWTIFKGIWDAVGLLLQGDVGGFFKTLGKAIVDYALMPLQMLASSLVALADLAGKGDWVPNTVRAFSEKGVAGLFDETKTPASETWKGMVPDEYMSKPMSKDQAEIMSMGIPSMLARPEAAPGVWHSPGDQKIELFIDGDQVEATVRTRQERSHARSHG